jgi:hypothetical protein
MFFGNQMHCQTRSSRYPAIRLCGDPSDSLMAMEQSTQEKTYFLFMDGEITAFVPECEVIGNAAGRLQLVQP